MSKVKVYQVNIPKKGTPVVTSVYGGNTGVASISDLPKKARNVIKKFTDLDEDDNRPAPSPVEDDEDWDDDDDDDQLEEIYPDVDEDVQDGEKVLSLELPGFSREDVTVKLDEDGGLLISGNNGEKEFYTEYSLSGDDNENDIYAELTDGILEITIGTVEDDSRDTREIPVN